jgi:membrane-associated HD superfamily phosphohydrolase
MLADGTEARARAIVPKDEAELRELINQTFDFIEKNGQLDDTNLTLRDLQAVKDSFFYTLMGTYHPRVKYPTLEKPSAQPVKQLTSETVKSSENND